MEMRFAGDDGRMTGTRPRWGAVARLLIDSNDPNDMILGRALERGLKANIAPGDLTLDVSEDAHRRVRHADAKLDFLARKFAWRPDMI